MRDGALVVGPRGAALLLLPGWALLLAIIVIPAGYVLWLSFQASSFGRAPVFVGLANYAHVLGDRYFWRALGNTVLLVLIVVHVELLAGLGMRCCSPPGCRRGAFCSPPCSRLTR